MTSMAIEMLTPERVTALWPVLEPHFAAASKGNEIAEDELDAKDVYVLAVTGLVAIFVYFEDGEPACVLGIQFNTTNGRKGADITALGGRNLMRFKAAYWHVILEWLRANGVQFVDAHTSNRFGKILLNRFGFSKSCMYVRMTL